MLGSKLSAVERGQGFQVTEGPSFSGPKPESIWEQIFRIELELAAELTSFVTESKQASFVYNPLDYAQEVHLKYLQQFINSQKDILYVGLNPGPNGMCQTGVRIKEPTKFYPISQFPYSNSLLTPFAHSQVPFGNISTVRDYLRLSGHIGQPDKAHPERKITGFDTKIEEPSGKRVWELISGLFPDPRDFSAFSGVLNLFPIAFYDAQGKNLLPEQFPAVIKKSFIQICLKHFIRIAAILQPKKIVCFGRFVETCLKGAKDDLSNADIIYIQHPSPRIPNNQNWVEKSRPLFLELSDRGPTNHGGGVPGGQISPQSQ